ETSTIILSNTSTSARTFIGNGKTFNNLVIGGATGYSTLTITGSNTFNTISSTKTVAHTIRFAAGSTTTVDDWTVTGSEGAVVTLRPVSGQFNIVRRSIDPLTGLDYLDVANSNATPGAVWLVGENSF